MEQLLAIILLFFTFLFIMFFFLLYVVVFILIVNVPIFLIIFFIHLVIKLLKRVVRFNNPVHSLKKIGKNNYARRLFTVSIYALITPLLFILSYPNINPLYSRFNESLITGPIRIIAYLPYFICIIAIVTVSIINLKKKIIYFNVISVILSCILIIISVFLIPIWPYSIALLVITSTELNKQRKTKNEHRNKKWQISIYIFIILSELVTI